MELGVSITLDASGFEAAFNALQPLLEFEGSELMSIIGAVGESQTRRRISDEKTAPSGDAWQPNLKGTSILVDTGQHLLYSIAHSSSETEAEWGSSWEYAHVHQEGMTIKPRNGAALKWWYQQGGAVNFAMAKQVTIPARPFVGLSSDNAEEIVELVTDYFGLAQ